MKNVLLRHLLALWCLFFAMPLCAVAAPASTSTPVAVVSLKNADAETRLALACLQGIVNRGAERPALYCAHSDSDRAWLDQLYAARGFQAVPTTPTEALARFADRLKARVIYDPAQPETINLATALAGLEDALPMARPDSPIAQAIGRQLPVVEDLRGRFPNAVAASQWAAEKLAPRCHQEKLALLAPTRMGLRDYLVAEKILPCGLDPAQPDSAAALRTLMDRFPVATRIYWGERVGPAAAAGELLANDSSVPALARAAGKLLVPGADAANLSFHSRVPAYAPLRQLKHLAKHYPVRYVCFLFSGEGNLDFALGRMRELWDAPARGRVPLGWDLPPALLELAPAVASSYYADALWSGTDQFVMAPSGASYLPPADATAQDAFHAAIDKAARQADLPALAILDATPADTESKRPLFLCNPITSGLLALGASGAAPTRVGDRPIVTETVRVTDVEKGVAAITAAAAKQRFVLAVMDPAACTPNDAVQIMARLGKEYMAVSPYLFLDLFAERHAIENFQARLLAPAKLERVTYTPSQLGPEDSVTVKASISGLVVDARVTYTVGDSPEFTERLVREGNEYRASLPPLLNGGTLKFRVRVTDVFLRTRFSDYSTLTVTAPDTDGDGRSDALERAYNLNPASPDTDGDGLRDGNDPAPLIPFARPKGVEGPIIIGPTTSPRPRLTAGRVCNLHALVFDPAGVKKVEVRLTADGNDLGGGEMAESGSSQVYEYRLPALTAGQTLTAEFTATNTEGKTSKLTASLPVSGSVIITQPSNGFSARRATVIQAQAYGPPAYLQVVINGYPVARITQPPYRYVWDPTNFYTGNHEIMVEAYDAENNLMDYDVIEVKAFTQKQRR